MKSISPHVMWLLVAVILAIATLVLFWIVFPRSDCDEIAQLSAIEIKDAIECAAKGGACDHTATVKFCQEDKFSITGVGIVQAYYGYMVPEYMIYYQKFPMRYPPDGWFSEEYPFMRASLGQRPWDMIDPRATMTEFKYFYNAKYLIDGCTDDRGLCFNLRGKEDIYNLGVSNSIALNDVKLVRDGQIRVDPNPKFYLVSPCYADISFYRGDDPNKPWEIQDSKADAIYAFVNRLDTKGAPNYCYADDQTIASVNVVAIEEGACEAIVIALSFGYAKAATTTARALIKTAIKTGLRMYGIPYGKVETIAYIARRLGVPCADTSICRSITSCFETSLWPGGFTPSETTSAHMKGRIYFDAAIDTLFECCNNYIDTKQEQGSVDRNDIVCEEPEGLVRLLKPVILTENNKDLTIADVLGYIGWSDFSESELESLCLASIPDYKIEKSDVEYNYNYYEKQEGKKAISVFIETAEDCEGEIAIEIKEKKEDEWTEIDRRVISEESNYYVIKNGFNVFQYLRLISTQNEDYNCKLKNTFIVLDASSDLAIEAETGKVYTLSFEYTNFFVTPESYSKSAKELCEEIENCLLIYRSDKGKYAKYEAKAYESGFKIGGGEKLGIVVNEKSEVVF